MRSLWSLKQPWREGIPCFDPLRSDLSAFSLVVRWVVPPVPVHWADPSVTSLQLSMVLL